MLAYPTSLAFKLGAHLSGANVVMSTKSEMAASNVSPEDAAHQLPMNHVLYFPCPTQWATQSSLRSLSQGLVKSVLPTTLLRYHFFVGVPGRP